MSDRPLRYVAIGDSLSEGVGDEPWPDGTPRGWTDRLAHILAAHHGRVEYANLAVRGYRAAQIRDRQLDDAVALEPDLLTITAGMNDLLRPRVDFDALRSTLVDIVAPFAARGTRMMFVPIPDVSSVSPIGRLLENRRRRLNDIYRYLSDGYGVLPPAETAGTVFEDRRGWDDDRLHLSVLGHERLALGAAAAFGVPTRADWSNPPAGPAPRPTLRTEAGWVWRYAVPWVNRHLHGRSSGDGRTAKLPTPVLLVGA